MAADRMSSDRDWVDAEIARQLELISIDIDNIEDDSDGEVDNEESTHQQVHYYS